MRICLENSLNSRIIVWKVHSNSRQSDRALKTVEIEREIVMDIALRLRAALYNTGKTARLGSLLSGRIACATSYEG